MGRPGRQLSSSFPNTAIAASMRLGFSVMIWTPSLTRSNTESTSASARSDCAAGGDSAARHQHSSSGAPYAPLASYNRAALDGAGIHQHDRRVPLKSSGGSGVRALPLLPARASSLLDDAAG